MYWYTSEALINLIPEECQHLFEEVVDPDRQIWTARTIYSATQVFLSQPQLPYCESRKINIHGTASEASILQSNTFLCWAFSFCENSGKYSYVLSPFNLFTEFPKTIPFSFSMATWRTKLNVKRFSIIMYITLISMKSLLPSPCDKP